MSPANLGGACDSCCCIEMQCCVPTTLIVVVEGFSGTSIYGDYGRRRYYSDHYPGPINSADFGSGTFDYDAYLEFLSRAGHPSEVWPGQMNYPVILDDYYQVMETYPVVTGHDRQFVLTSEEFGTGYWILTPKQGHGTPACFNSGNDCESFPIFCETPPTEEKTFVEVWGAGEALTINAPANPHVRNVWPGQWADYLMMEFDEDRNGIMVCTRRFDFFNPNIKYTIARQNADVDGQTDAILLYEVEGERNPELTAIGGPPTVVDYRCTPRNVPSVDDPSVGCLAPIGYARPHICAYSGTGNNSADLRPRLCPQMISTWDIYPWPATWRVCGLDIIDPGSGYAVGDMIYCAFCPSPLFGGEFYLNEGPSSFDEGGYGPVEYNRFMVTAVDENGGIVSVYLLRTFYIDPLYGVTEFTMQWGRQLCHAQSVLSGGSNYAVGDTITFQCVSNNCETVEDAVAYVADVDENGTILDWYISGSDAWKSYYPFGFCPTDTFPDSRGKYRWNTVHVCSTTWKGVVPVRRVASGNDLVAEEKYNWDDPGLSLPDHGCLNFVETHITSITKVPADTAINIICAEPAYPYNQPYTPVVQALFPPFPPCVGGGASASPIITPGGNDSTLGGGGPITAVTIHNPGVGYSFRQRRHVEPILPTQISGGAEFSYTFNGVGGFPIAGLEYFDPQGYQIPSDRYRYFYVSGVEVVSGGSGYTVGDEFYIGPDGAIPNNDIPEDCPNGTWYSGWRARTLLYKYDLSIEDWVQQGDEFYWKWWPEDSFGWYELVEREPRLHLTVTEVDEDGAITAVEITHGGMMYKTEWVGWRQHPLLHAFVTSNTGYGCALNIQVEENENGGITSITVAEGTGLDPEHLGQTMPTGGRDYIDAEAGYIWKLNPSYPVLAGTDLGVNRFGGRSTHKVVRGELPPFVPPSKLVSTERCPNSLLSKTYEIYRITQQDFIEGEYKPLWALELVDPENDEYEQQYMGYLGTNYCVLESLTLPGLRDLVEWGMTMTLSYVQPEDCPDLDDGVA